LIFQADMLQIEGSLERVDHKDDGGSWRCKCEVLLKSGIYVITKFVKVISYASARHCHLNDKGL
jgi:hypothetical protein